MKISEIIRELGLPNTSESLMLVRACRKPSAFWIEKVRRNGTARWGVSDRYIHWMQRMYQNPTLWELRESIHKIDPEFP